MSVCVLTSLVRMMADATRRTASGGECFIALLFRMVPNAG